MEGDHTGGTDLCVYYWLSLVQPGCQLIRVAPLMALSANSVGVSYRHCHDTIDDDEKLSVY